MTSLLTAASASATLLAMVRSCRLVGARLWDLPPPRTSQRRAAQGVLAEGLMASLIIGGNRSGKTQLGAMMAVAWALGRTHPYTQAWARVNGLDPSVIPEKGGRVCAVSLTNLDSVKVQRRAVDAYLPPGAHWYRREALTEAKVTLPGGGAIIFKTDHQGPAAFQGDVYDLLWLDEEPSERVFNEARMRLVDRAGRAIFTMTPLKGRTWVYRRFIQVPEAGSSVVWLHSRDNPHIPQDYLEALLSQYGPHERAARERGEFTSLEGRVYSFYRHLHTIPPFPIPASWPRFQAWDFGTRNPTAIIWAALDPSDDTLYVYRERYQAGHTIRSHGQAVVDLERCQCCGGYPIIPLEDLGEDWEEAREHWSTQTGLTWESIRWDSQEEDWRPPPGWEVLTLESHPGMTDLHPDWRTGHPRAVACLECREHPGRVEPVPSRVGDPAARGERTYLVAHFNMAIRPAKNEVRAGISRVAERLAPDVEGRVHLRVFRDCIATIQEFEGYAWDTRVMKGDQPDKPLKKDDHAMDAIRYLVQDVAQGSVGIEATY